MLVEVHNLEVTCFSGEITLEDAFMTIITTTETDPYLVFIAFISNRHVPSSLFLRPLIKLYYVDLAKDLAQ